MPDRIIIYRLHALLRMIERGIALSDVEAAIAQSEVIETYLDDEPYPSRLVLGWSGGRPLHIVLADSTDGRRTLVITVYVPDTVSWLPGFHDRRRE